MLVCLCVVVACGQGRGNPPNVVVILVDTLRQDHVGCYGHDRDTTPAIDAFADDAVKFERAYATSPWTMPTVASMFTGLYPGRHRVRTINMALPGEITTLAEILQQQGYATAGVVSHVLLDRRHRFDQGFAEYVEVFDERRPHETVTTGKVTDAALQLLDGFGKRRDPFFMFVHYFDPHYNYKRHPEVGFAPESVGRLDGAETIMDLYDLMDDMTEAEIALVEAIYDEEVRHTDGGVGRLLQALNESGRFEDTWIVILSDHGEEFMEHGNIGHTITLFEELVKVPLVIRPPEHSTGARSIDAPVSLVSLTPTLLDGLEIDSGLGFQGQSLLPLMMAGGEGEDVIYCETDQLVNKRGVIVGRNKIVRDLQTGELELYDIIADPTEQFDRSELDPDLVAHLVSVLDRRIAWMAEDPMEAEPIRLSDEQLEQLKSLGYVGE